MTRQKVGLKTRKSAKARQQTAERKRTDEEKRRMTAELDRRQAETSRRKASEKNRRAEKKRASMEKMRQTAEKTRQAAEVIRWKSMKAMQAQEMIRQSGELMHSSLVDRLQNYIERVPQIIEDFQRAAANQLKEMEKISALAKEMLQATQQMVQKVPKQRKTRL